MFLSDILCIKLGWVYNDHVDSGNPSRVSLPVSHKFIIKRRQGMSRPYWALHGSREGMDEQGLRRRISGLQAENLELPPQAQRDDRRRPVRPGRADIKSLAQTALEVEPLASDPLPSAAPGIEQATLDTVELNVRHGGICAAIHAAAEKAREKLLQPSDVSPQVAA